MPFVRPHEGTRADRDDGERQIRLDAGALATAGRRRHVRCATLVATALACVLYRYTRASQISLALGDVPLILSSSDETLGSRLLEDVESQLTGIAGDRPVELSFTVAASCERNVLVTFDPQASHLRASAECVFKDGALVRMLGHVETVLEALVVNADVPIGDMPLLAPDEYRRMLVDWNATRQPFGRDTLIHEWFEEAVERFPGRSAVIFGDEVLSYAELNACANRLAHRLAARGVGPESRVGLYLRRTPSLVVAVLAVLKAGAAYVPLDPVNPPARLALMMQDAGLNFLVCESTLASHVRDFAGETVDVDAELRLDGRSENPPRRATPGNAAYVMYTSGSTGTPKGVVIEHRSLAAFVAWTHRAFSDEERSVVLCASSIAFDVSVCELFAPLSGGGATVLVDDLLALPDAPAREKVRMICATASGLTALTETTMLPSSVTTILQAGELMHGTLAAALYAQPGVCRVLNACGATEDTVYSVSYEVSRGEHGNPPIGRPLHNHEAYVVDARMQPVPVGVPGELYYAGAGVAREYLNRPELNRERFVANPFSSSPYRRLYRSGDVVRWRSDGNLEYVSRADDQLKVRGFRVELAEIEAVLAAHPGIRDVAVAARKTGGGDTILVAFAVLRDGASLSIADVQRHAALRLPEFMVPGALVVMESLPRSASGKIDRSGLRDARREPPRGDVTPEAADEIEAALLDVWRNVFGNDAIGVDDHFLELGGHSLIAVRLVAKIAERLGVTVRPRDVFDAPRPRQLADRIRGNIGSRATSAS